MTKRHKVTGYTRTQDVKNETAAGVRKFVERLRDEPGVKTTKDVKTQRTRSASIQGNWHPFLFAAPGKFPVV